MFEYFIGNEKKGHNQWNYVFHITIIMKIKCISIRFDKRAFNASLEYKINIFFSLHVDSEHLEDLEINHVLDFYFILFFCFLIILKSENCSNISELTWHWTKMIFTLKRNSRVRRTTYFISRLSIWGIYYISFIFIISYCKIFILLQP